MEENDYKVVTHLPINKLQVDTMLGILRDSQPEPHEISSVNHWIKILMDVKKYNQQ